jgi:tRNA:m4X modification enzyme
VQTAVGAAVPAAYVAVDRARVRHRRDPAMTSVAKSAGNGTPTGTPTDPATAGPRVARACVDIANLDLAAAPLVAGNPDPVVLCGKHLCGAATDMTLACVANQRGETFGSAEPPAKRSGPPPHVAGLCIALCCHQRCDWAHYVNRSFFVRRGFSAREFKIITLLSSWAICGVRSPAAGKVGEALEKTAVGTEEAGEADEEEHDQV